MEERRFNEFQLHHTGIKTDFSLKVHTVPYEFQLHHTGIKTGFVVLLNWPAYYFNCTIQELKRASKCGRRLQYMISIAPYRN